MTKISKYLSAPDKDRGRGGRVELIPPPPPCIQGSCKQLSKATVISVISIPVPLQLYLVCSCQCFSIDCRSFCFCIKSGSSSGVLCFLNSCPASETAFKII